MYLPKRTTETGGKLAQTQSSHIQVLLLFVLHHLLVTRLYDYTLLQHIYETEFHPKYTQVNTTHEDERRTLRQLCKRLYRRQDGSSAQQSTATHSLIITRTVTRWNATFGRRHTHTRTYMNSWARWNSGRQMVRERPANFSLE